MPLKVTLVDVPMKELKQDVTETHRISFVGNSFCSERSLARQRPHVGYCLPSDVSCLCLSHLPSDLSFHMLCLCFTSDLLVLVFVT